MVFCKTMVAILFKESLPSFSKLPFFVCMLIQFLTLFHLKSNNDAMQLAFLLWASSPPCLYLPPPSSQIQQAA